MLASDAKAASTRTYYYTESAEGNTPTTGSLMHWGRDSTDIIARPFRGKYIHMNDRDNNNKATISNTSKNNITPDYYMHRNNNDKATALLSSSATAVESTAAQREGSSPAQGVAAAATGTRSTQRNGTVTTTTYHYSKESAVGGNTSSSSSSKSANTFLHHEEFNGGGNQWQQQPYHLGSRAHRDDAAHRTIQHCNSTAAEARVFPMELEHAVGFSPILDGVHVLAPAPVSSEEQKVHRSSGTSAVSSSYLHVVGGCLVLCDVRDPHSQVFLRGHNDDISCVAVAPQSGSFFVSGQRGRDADVCIWDRATLEVTHRFSEIEHGVALVAVAPDETLVAAVGRNRVVYFLNPVNGSLVARLGAVTSTVCPGSAAAAAASQPVAPNTRNGGLGLAPMKHSGTHDEIQSAVIG